MSEYLKLLPDGYYTIEDKPMIFFCPEKYCSMNEEIKEITNTRSMVIASTNKEGTYTAFLGGTAFNFCKGQEGKANFSITYFYNRQQYEIRRNNLYYNHADTFTLLCPEGLSIINIKEKAVYNKNGIVSGSGSWEMDVELFRSISDKLKEYFSLSGQKNEAMEQKEIALKTKLKRRKADKNVYNYFEEYTDKEEYLALEASSMSTEVHYDRCEYEKTMTKAVKYRFYTDLSMSELENDDKDEIIGNDYRFLREGANVQINTENGMMKGMILCPPEVAKDENGSEKAVITITFDTQIDCDTIPQSGVIKPTMNDKTASIRRFVLRNLKAPGTQINYMLDLFSNYQTGGYKDVDEELVEYLIKSLDTEYPPNQMQLEAIIKGILTEDVLLVLGPPGTGKTTVIRLWAEYFMAHGMKVLISSQNNSAVDNVLKAFVKGKSDKVLRLGASEKVMESCQGLLPENKIHAMRAHFQNVEKMNTAALLTNKENLAAALEKLNEKKQLLDETLKRRKSSSLRIDSIKRRIADMKKLLAYHKEQNKLLNEKKKQLQEANDYILQRSSSNIFSKLFSSGKAKRIKRDIILIGNEIGDIRERLNTAASNYNYNVNGMQEELNRLRKAGYFVNTSRDLMISSEISDFIHSRDAVPELDGVISSHITDISPKMPGDISIHAMEACGDALDRCISEVSARLKQLTEAENSLKRWFSTINSERNDALQDILINSCSLVGATCIGINTRRAFAKVNFDVAILDESGQIQIHNALVPMSRAPKLLMLGDHKQIPPLVSGDMCRVCENEGIDTKLLKISFFEHLFENMNNASANIYARETGEGNERKKLLEPLLPYYTPTPHAKMSEQDMRRMIGDVVKDHKKTVNLNSQFRMPGNISEIISMWFYNNNYYSSYDMKRFKPILPGTSSPMIIVDTSDSDDRFVTKQNDGSFYNDLEAELIAEMIEKTIMSQPESERNIFCQHIEEKIGIISAYKGQINRVRAAIKKRNIGIREDQLRSLSATLDSFQGQERPLIIYSFTRSDDTVSEYHGRIGFMSELRRINVAFTRCKDQLVLVGDIPYLSNCRKISLADYQGDSVDIDYPCRGHEEKNEVTSVEAEQCEKCRSSIMKKYNGFVCEKQFGRFIRLMCSHVRNGNGEYFHSSDYTTYTNIQ